MGWTLKVPRCQLVSFCGPKEKGRIREGKRRVETTHLARAWVRTPGGGAVQSTEANCHLGGSWTGTELWQQRGFYLGPDLGLHQAQGGQFSFYILLATKKGAEWRKGVGSTQILPARQGVFTVWTQGSSMFAVHFPLRVALFPISLHSCRDVSSPCV